MNATDPLGSLPITARNSERFAVFWVSLKDSSPNLRSYVVEKTFLNAMKGLVLPTFSFFAFLLTANAQLKTSFGGLSPDDPALNNTPIILTDEELADPPVGEIRKVYLNHYVNRVRATLAANLANAPSGPDGQASPWMAKFQAIKVKLDQMGTTRLQRDLFELIPMKKEVFEGHSTPGFSNFFALQDALLRDLGVPIIHTIGEYVRTRAGEVSASDLVRFVDVFCNCDLISSSDWEDEVMPIDAAGVFILDASTIADNLKTRPWKRAEEFLGGETAASAFKTYEAGGSGMELLKTKYTANKETIVSKWQELATWVEQQKAANP